MRLADFIVANTEIILLQWDTFARSTKSGAMMDTHGLRDHAADILLATTQDMRSSQSVDPHSDKAMGLDLTRLDDARLDEASEAHAIGRLGAGFDLMEVVSEYRALRASVLRLWRASAPQPNAEDLDDLTRFNESIDRSVAKAVSSYTKRVDESRDMFLAILGHDLRNPLNSIAVSAQLLPRKVNLDAESTEFASNISSSAAVMAQMISDLLDYTRTRLGAGMPITPARMDLGVVAREVFDEYRSAHPSIPLRFHTSGDLTGKWDPARLRQVVSNLLGNAIQHGDQRRAIELTLAGDANDVVITIHNQGAPILPGDLIRIFDPLVRGADRRRPRRNRPGSIGLGLFIARELVTAHGGRIDVKSSEPAGSVFTIHLPRHFRNVAAQIRPGASLTSRVEQPVE